MHPQNIEARLDIIQQTLDGLVELLRKSAGPATGKPMDTKSEGYSALLSALGIKPESVAKATSPTPDMPPLMSRQAAIDFLFEKFNKSIDKETLKAKVQYAVRNNTLPILNEDGSPRTERSNKKSFLRTKDLLEFSRGII